MISATLMLISLYVAWFYRSFKNENEPSWVENGDVFVYATIPELILEIAIYIAYLNLKG